jgi:hypothetical protein
VPKNFLTKKSLSWRDLDMGQTLTKRPGSTSGEPSAKRQKNGTGASSSSTAVAHVSSAKCYSDVPVDVWREHICQKFIDLTELSTLRTTHTFFEEYWQNVMDTNIIRVPQGCSTVAKAMALAVAFSKKKEYTTDDPLKIRLEKGVHEIVRYRSFGRMDVTCSHITFVGKGKEQTTVRGGFSVRNQQHVTFEELTITNPTGNGLTLYGSETTVDVSKCIVKECSRAYGMFVGGGATGTATQCEFVQNDVNGVYCANANTKARLTDCTMHHNGGHGLVAMGAVVDLHGTKTDIHSNKRNGIWAWNCAKVNIHLPSQHNTSHGNVGEDRHQWGVEQSHDNGSIANINADGSFTHVVVVVEEDDDY